MNFLFLQNLIGHNAKKSNLPPFILNRQPKAEINIRNRLWNYVSRNFAGHSQAANTGNLVLQHCMTAKTKVLMYRNTSTSKLVAVTHQPHGFSRLLEVAHEICGFERYRYSSALVYKDTALRFLGSCKKNRLWKHRKVTYFSIMFNEQTNQRWSQVRQNDDLTYFCFWPEGAQHTLVTKYYLAP